MTLAASVLEGNRLAIARLLTEVENSTLTGRDGLNELFPHTGHAHLIGVTGAPGTGKSTLVNQLALFFRHPPEDLPVKRVAVVAVDPTSPFSGGAILGDRVRMRDLSGDPGVFIRSMATRGTLGGIAAATSAFCQVLDAAGFEVIFIETVGVGQAEVDIVGLAHTTLVIEAPDLGDEIQAIKAGILEIADILVVNKADRPMIENTERALKGMLEMATISTHTHHGKILETTALSKDTNGWVPPVLRTVATEGHGIMELGKTIIRHHDYLKQSGLLKEREQARLQTELELWIGAKLVERWKQNEPDQVYRSVLQAVFDRKISPRQAAEQLLGSVLE